MDILDTQMVIDKLEDILDISKPDFKSIRELIEFKRELDANMVVMEAEVEREYQTWLDGADQRS
jgi:hypothetical protein|tara:strand:- start:4347 stop:4538 length:192 start_codon:yes stop_codon:yes gene_type:complete